MTDPRATTDALRQRIAALSPERRALFEQELQQQGLSLEKPASVEPAITSQVRSSTLPLSPAQRNLWVLHRLNPDCSAYHIAMSWQLKGSLDILALECSLHAIAQRHESLRTVFVEQGGQPCQRVLSAIPSSFWSAADLRMLPETAMQAEMQRLTEQSVRRPFHLSRGPLFRSQLIRLDETTSILLLTLHHIVADGWSRGVLMRELATLYRDFCEGNPVSLSPLPIQYADYALWQEQWLQSDDCRVQLDYWRKQLASLPVLELPSDYPRPAFPNFASRTCTHILALDRVAALKALSRQQGTTLFMTLLAAFKLLLHRYSAQEDICIGVPVANRDHLEVEPLIGFFVNTLVLRSHLTGTITFRDLLQQIKRTTADAFQHQEVPFTKVVEALQPGRDLSQNPLFQVMFQLQSSYQLQNAATPDLDLPGLSLSQTWVDSGHTKFDMTWHGIERDDGLLLAVEYRVDLFEASRIQRMLRHFQMLLDSILANPDRPLAELSLLSATEQHQLLVELNQTEAPLPDRCFHQCFEDQVEKTPDAIAVIDPDQTLTYRQLDCRANQLARTLQNKGIRPEMLVGVCLPRSVNLMVALLGVLKAGGAYVPLEPSLPKERLNFILDDAKVSLLVTTNAGLLGIDGLTDLAVEDVRGRNAHPTRIQVLDLEGDRDQIDMRSIQPSTHPPVHSQNLAYVLYTSGSTGKPKGTLLTHRGLINYLRWCTQAYDMAAGEGTPVTSSIGFDATITSLFAPLLVGQSVTLLAETHDIEALSEALQKGDRFSLIKLTPSHLRALAPLLRKCDTSASQHSDALLNQLRCDKSASLPSVNSSAHPLIHSSPPNAFIIGGEALHAHDLAFWQQHFPNTRFINEYGPTEAVVGCCIYDIPLDIDSDAVPIGRPIANVQLYVLDPYLEPVPVGIPGELYIGGAGIARGYLNQPDLTAERFVPNPFVEVGSRRSEFGKQDLGFRSQESETNQTNHAPRTTHHKQPITNNQRRTLYKTGDRARYRSNGTLEYLGRMDDQIKLRGYRIEPGEIEAFLCQHPDVEQAVVVLRDDVGEAAKLVAYLVLESEARSQDLEEIGKNKKRRTKSEKQIQNTLREEQSSTKFKTPNSSTPFRIPNSVKLRPSRRVFRTHLSQHLSLYMLPDHFVVLDEVPLTVNGKVDRQALPLPEVKVTASDVSSKPRTDVEVRLAGIWAAILRRDRVSIHDNFFELGGDSILGMQIIARAHQGGLHLTPRQLFQYQTVAELAAVAEVRSQTPISQDAVTGSVLLTPIQRDFFAQELPEPAHFNQAIMVTIAADVQPQVLERALQQLVIHHDGLRSRFYRQDNEWQQVIQDPNVVAVPLDEINLANVSVNSQAAALEKAVNNLQTSLNLADGPLFRAALLHLGDKGDRLLLIAHHLIVDGVSWRILLEDLVTAYHRLEAGHSGQEAGTLLPPKTQSFQSWAHLLVNLAYTGTFDTERSYWREVCAAGALPLPVDFEKDTPNNTVASVDEIVITLDADQTQKLLEEGSRGYNAQVNDVLLTVLGQTLKAWIHSSAVLIDLEGHGRHLPIQNLQDLQSLADGLPAGDIDVSRTVGWFTAVYPLRLMVPAGAIADQLKAVKEQLRKVPNQGIGYSILRYLTPSSDPALVSLAEVSFNYLGQVNSPSIIPAPSDSDFRIMPSSSRPLIHSLATESVGLLRSPLGKRRYLLEVIALVREGHLQVIWRYSRRVHRRTTIEAIAQRYLATLQSHTTQCGQALAEETYTPSDFAAARVDQTQLDQLLTKIRGD